MEELWPPDSHPVHTSGEKEVGTLEQDGDTRSDLGRRDSVGPRWGRDIKILNTSS